MTSRILKSGLIAGSILTVFLIIVTYMMMNSPDFSDNMVFGYTMMVLSFSIIFFGLKNYRDHENNGELSFGQAFKGGLLIAAIGSVIYVIVWAICYNFFVPDFLDAYAEHCMRQAVKDGASAQELADKKEMLQMTREWYKNPFLFALVTFSEVFPVGLVVALISAFLLKKKRKTALA
jgi:amino acid transporter